MYQVYKPRRGLKRSEDTKVRRGGPPGCPQPRPDGSREPGEGVRDAHKAPPPRCPEPGGRRGVAVRSAHPAPLPAGDLQAAPQAHREEAARPHQRVHRPAQGPAARAPQAHGGCRRDPLPLPQLPPARRAPRHRHPGGARTGAAPAPASAPAPALAPGAPTAPTAPHSPAEPRPGGVAVPGVPRTEGDSLLCAPPGAPKIPVRRTDSRPGLPRSCLPQGALHGERARGCRGAAGIPRARGWPRASAPKCITPSPAAHLPIPCCPHLLPLLPSTSSPATHCPVPHHPLPLSSPPPSPLLPCHPVLAPPPRTRWQPHQALGAQPSGSGCQPVPLLADPGSPGEGCGSRAYLEACESANQPHRAAAAENNCFTERFTSG